MNPKVVTQYTPLAEIERNNSFIKCLRQMMEVDDANHSLAATHRSTLSAQYQTEATTIHSEAKNRVKCRTTTIIQGNMATAAIK
jgi:hypothetical protein